MRNTMIMEMCVRIYTPFKIKEVQPISTGTSYLIVMCTWRKKRNDFGQEVKLREPLKTIIETDDIGINQD